MRALSRPKPQPLRPRRVVPSDRWVGWLLVAPSLLFIFGLLGYPLLYSLVIMFMDLNITRPWLGPQFVGLGNFIDMAQAPEFWASLGRTLYFAAVSIILGTPVALIFAILLNQDFPLRGLARGLMMIPWAIPHVVNGVIWARIYDANYGMLNGLLYQLGLIQSYIPWLTNPNLALFLVVIAEVWVSTPGLTLLFLAGLQTIPSELYEAASCDGAGMFQRFWYITLPLLKPMGLVVLVLKTISAFGIFDIVYVLTGGGPANSTQVLGYYIYMESFKYLHVGYGAALSYVVAAIILVLVFIYVRLLRFESIREGA
jgi:ABC-type sugar transport system permease subunit